MKKLLTLCACAALAPILTSCGATDPNGRKPFPITIGYQTTAGGHTIAAGYSTTTGIAVNVSAK